MLTTRLVLAGISGSTIFIINNHVNIAIMYIVILYVGQINEHSDSDMGFVHRFFPEKL